MYTTNSEFWLDYWSVGTDDGQRISYTNGGLAWLAQWGSLRYAANTAMVAMVYVDLLGDKPDNRYTNFAKSQIDYMLGDNPLELSYMCGFGELYPVQPHHGAASGLYNGFINSPEDNRHILYGALVGGPKSPNDYDYQDERGDYVGNEVAMDYNAGFTGALAALSLEYGGTVLPDEEFPPIVDPTGEEFFVEGQVHNLNDHSVELHCWINNRSAWPPRASETLSYKIFLDLTEVVDASIDPFDVYTTFIYTDGAQVGDIEPWDVANNIYFVNINYNNRNIYPGTSTSYHRICKVVIGIDETHPASAWNITNDPSITDLPISQDTFLKTPLLPVYEDNQLLWAE